MRKICEAFPRKLFFDGGMADWEETNLPVSEFEKMGMKIVIYPLVGIYAAMRAVQDVYKPLLEQGQITVEHLQKHSVGMSNVNQILGIDRCYAMYDDYQLT